MSYVMSRQSFESAKQMTDDEAIQTLAEGLISLSRAIENDLNKQDRDLAAIKRKVG